MVGVILQIKQGLQIRTVKSSSLKIFVANALIDTILGQMVFVKKSILFVIHIIQQQEYVILASLDLFYPMEAAMYKIIILPMRTVKLGREKYAFNAHKELSLMLMGNAKQRIHSAKLMIDQQVIAFLATISSICFKAAA